MIETVVLIPRRDNGGRLFEAYLWRELETRLLAFGGYAYTDGVHGTWRSGARLYRDVSRQYTVALTSWWQLPVWLDLVDWARVAFSQEALYVSVAGVPEIRSG